MSEKQEMTLMKKTKKMEETKMSNNNELYKSW